jgi:hypothetical protein
MKNLKTKDWAVIAGEAGLFFIVIIFIWIDEFVDLPNLLLGAPPTLYRAQEFIIETVSILVLALVVISITFISLRRARRIERFLRVCAWCRKVWVDNEWVSFEEYVLKKHSLKSSHGICENCVTRLEKKHEQKRDGQTGELRNRLPHSMQLRYQKPFHKQ